MRVACEISAGEPRRPAVAGRPSRRRLGSAGSTSSGSSAGPPGCRHQYLLNLRIEQARVLLRRGVPPAEVAASVGFADQSHLNRHFKRYVGSTPGTLHPEQYRSRQPASIALI